MNLKAQRDARQHHPAIQAVTSRMEGANFVALLPPQEHVQWVPFSVQLLSCEGAF